MWKELLEALRAKLGTMKLSEAFIAQLITLAEATVGKVTDKAQATLLLASIEDAGKKLAEQVAAGATGNLTLTLNVPDTFKAGMTEDQVKKLMADAATAAANEAKTLAESRDKLVKLLGDTIGAATGIEAALKKELTDAVADLITPSMTEDQVKKLAAAQIASGNRIAVASRLAGMGYPVAGTTHISVDDSNSVKALQENFDKRLVGKLKDAQRFERTGGKLLDVNKELAEQVLAMYDLDARNAQRLRAEHKMLAGGDGLVSDVAVPAIFERTVIREALYNLIGLQFVDVGTYAFSGSAIIPYSYRDTTAAGRTGTRKYEGQAVARAGVKQTSETAYPIPQKLAFEVSDELRYLTSNGQLQWDAVIENVRNATRVIGEDTEKLIFDEQLNASDQYAVTAVTNEAVATADGTNTIFVLDHFPVVRPKLVYDLQGNQVGSTLYAVTVKTNSVTRSEYDGTGTQSAGIYYTMDYNLGEVHIVDESGAALAPTNGHAVVVSYSYTTNVYKFDTDEGAEETDVHWNGFLYRYGLRKAVIEDDRYYMANFGLMSGTVRTMIEQAKQFSANYSRPGTDLTQDGNLGVIKGVPNFKTTAPGLAMADARIIIGQRAVSRYRMMKPWAMGQLQDQKNSDGRFTGKKEAYGDQFVVLHTPTQLKAALTSIVLYSSSARIHRAA